jgi:hypothetical protein
MCPYAMVLTDISIRKAALPIFHEAIKRLKNTVILQMRRFNGPGYTTLEEKDGKTINDTLLTTLIGFGRSNPTTVGYDLKITFMHGTQAEIADQITAASMPDDNTPVWGTLEAESVEQPSDEDEIVLNTPKRRLRRKQSR